MLLLNGYGWNKRKRSHRFSIPKQRWKRKGFGQQGREEARNKDGSCAPRPVKTTVPPVPLNILHNHYETKCLKSLDSLLIYVFGGYKNCGYRLKDQENR